MNTKKFRFYSEIPLYIRVNEDIEPLDEQFIEDFFLPRQYWREGIYLFAALKNRNFERTKRKGMFGYSEYKSLCFFQEKWFLSTETESEYERLNLHQPSQKEWELMLRIPEKYLNEYYKSYRQYWYWFHETNRMKYDTKLWNYKISKKSN